MKKVLTIIFILFIIDVLSFGVWFLFLNKRLVIKNYEEELVVNLNDNYVDKVPNICYGSIVSCKKLEIDVKNDVDTKVIGNYEIEYSYQYLEQVETLIKKVRVIDVTKPNITVDGTLKVCPNGKIISDNYESIDDYDGDITNNVKLIDVDGQYYLESVDSSGNNTQVLVDVLKEDAVKPEIKLTGDKVYLQVNEKYQEKGFIASDNCDGDITSNVTVTNNINIKKAGNYEVVYKIVDSSGNETSITRKVAVIKKNNVINPTGKTIYLTFDDGPGPYTGKLLDILDKYNVKATFFVTNQFPTYQKYIKEAYNRGHSIGIHTYTHNFNIYRSVDSYFNDLNLMGNLIKKLTGAESKIVRFPGGSSNTISRNYQKGIMSTLVNELTSRGYSYFDWNLDSRDAGGLTTSSAVSNQIIKNLNGGTKMVLLHDIKSYTVNAMETVIQEALSRGYTFEKVNINSPTYHHGLNN